MHGQLSRCKRNNYNFISWCLCQYFGGEGYEATRHGINDFLEHYSKTSVNFLGQLLLPIDKRSEGLCYLASLEFAEQWRKVCF